MCLRLDTNIAIRAVNGKPISLKIYGAMHTGRAHERACFKSIIQTIIWASAHVQKHRNALNNVRRRSLPSHSFGRTAVVAVAAVAAAAAQILASVCMWRCYGRAISFVYNCATACNPHFFCFPLLLFDWNANWLLHEKCIIYYICSMQKCALLRIGVRLS